MKYQKPKGTADILPGESEKWHFIEETARKVFNQYDFRELRTPIFEHFEVVSRSVGETTDIVTKEMYDFYDKGDRHITLRPEGTAPLVRSYVENKLYGPEYQRPFKGFYMGPMFRYERPQAGRFRQFHQIGAEVIGSSSPMTDVETMIMLLDFYKELGITHTRLVINSLGDRESRKRYRQALIEYLEPLADQLSADSQKRLHDNPLRVLDSKDAKDQPIVEKAPSILDYLDEPSTTFFQEVQRLLTGLGVAFEVDHRMVRGLDYYNHTVFEIMSDAPGFEGAITTICAGGRYDGLIGEFAGPADVDTGFGFALGIERTLITLEAEGVSLEVGNQIDAYVIGFGEKTDLTTMELAHFLREQGLTVEQDFLNRNLKPQLKSANKLAAKFVVIIGEAELAQNRIQLKNMETGAEQQVTLTDFMTNFATIYRDLME